MKLTRRRLMILSAAGAIGTASALDSDGEDGTIFGGKMALNEAFKIADGLWLGPDSTKADVDADNGDVFMASDTDVDYFYDGEWKLRNIGSSAKAVPSVTTDELNNKYKSPSTASEIQSFIDDLNSANGGVVDPEPGSYTISSTITVKPGVVLDLTGVTITHDSDVDLIQLKASGGDIGRVVNGFLDTSGNTFTSSAILLDGGDESGDGWRPITGMERFNAPAVWGTNGKGDKGASNGTFLHLRCNDDGKHIWLQFFSTFSAVGFTKGVHAEATNSTGAGSATINGNMFGPFLLDSQVRLIDVELGASADNSFSNNYYTAICGPGTEADPVYSLEGQDTFHLTTFDVGDDKEVYNLGADSKNNVIYEYAAGCDRSNITDNGSKNEFVTSHGGGQSCVCELTSDQTIEGTLERIEWDDVTSTALYSDTNAAKDRITVQEPGEYLVSAQVTWAADNNWSAGDRARVKIVTSDKNAQDNTQKQDTNEETRSVSAKQVTLSEGDTIDIRVSHNNANNQAIVGIAERTYLSITRLRE